MCCVKQDLSVLSAAISHCSPLPRRPLRTGPALLQSARHPCPAPMTTHSLATWTRQQRRAFGAGLFVVYVVDHQLLPLLKPRDPQLWGRQGP